MSSKKVGIPAGITGPQLAEAIVAMVEGRADRSAQACGVKTARQVEGLAKIGLDLCKKGACFFCAGPYVFKVKTKSKKIVWSDLPLHDCMNALREQARPETAPAVTETPATAPTPPVVSTNQKHAKHDKNKVRNSKNYKEVYPWRDLEALRTAVKKREVNLNDVMYEDTCAVKTCRKPFQIKAGTIVRALKKNGRYTQQRKCKDCALKAINASLEAAGVDPAAIPSRKQPQFKKLEELTAPLGEIAQRHATPEELAVHEAAKTADETTAASA